MSKSIIRMIALDMDGTLLGPEINVIASEAKKALEQVHKRGIKIIIASGRPYESIVGTLSKNGITPDKGYPQSLVINGYIYFLKRGNYLPLKKWNNFLRDESEKCLPTCKNIMKSGMLQFKKMGYIFEKQNECVLSFHPNVEHAILARRLLNKRIKEKGITNIKVGRNVTLVGIEFKDATKGRGLKKTAEIMKIHPEQVLAIGDSQNDEDMLDGRFGFKSATVYNADEEMKKVVMNNNGYIASKPLGEGVAEILKNEVL